MNININLLKNHINFFFKKKIFMINIFRNKNSYLKLNY